MKSISKHFTKILFLSLFSGLRNQRRGNRLLVQILFNLRSFLFEMGQVLSNLISIVFGRKQRVETSDEENVYHALDDHYEEVKPIHPTSGYGKTRVSEEDEGSVVIVITDADQVREDAAEPFPLVSGDPETRLSEDERVITIIVGNGVEAVEKIKPVTDAEVRVDAEPFPLLFVDPKTRVSEDERAREDVDPYLLVAVDSKPRISEDEKVREDAAEPFPLVSGSPETRVSEDERVITIIVDSGVELEAAEKIKPTLDVSTGDKITVPKDGSRAKRRKRRAKRKPRVSEDEKVREDVADPFPPASVYRHQTKVSEDERGVSIVDNGVEVVEKIEHIIHISTGDRITVSKDDLQEERRIKHYSCSHKILLVGEGDFSFSACLAKAFGSANNMVATSLDSEGFLKKNYRKAMSNINDLKSRGCMVLHGVDATTMSSHEFLKDMRFDRIVFNFPYAGWFKKKSRENQIRFESGNNLFCKARISLHTYAPPRPCSKEILVQYCYTFG
ncbi:uncharacterized protein LOC122057439 isoform X2 [Macadamia integrifolia]|uniref:uncharacterized protein LOC122057439 isoform X2 n=1 Tax=Macadamia integrifolia TaxID=60698 RepID=UPI001C53200D|nr:uncharacterized protein LOC122057439 isoform X2 [Macadamia integrifolia]